MKKIKKITVGGLMIALATALSFFGIKMPFGGSMTLGSMVPIIAISYIFDFKFSLTVGFAYSLLQMVCDFSPPPVQDFSSFFAVIMIDYIIAFTSLGLAGQLSSKIKNIKLRYVSGTAAVIVIRFLCHFLSGILIWSFYAPEGQSPLIYSLLYNGAYMGGELILTTVLMCFLATTIQELKTKL